MREAKGWSQGELARRLGVSRQAITSGRLYPDRMGVSAKAALFIGLAHLGFVPAPAPLDRLSLFTVILFAAGFFPAGRRGLLAQGF